MFEGLVVDKDGLCVFEGFLERVCEGWSWIVFAIVQECLVLYAAVFLLQMQAVLERDLLIRACVVVGRDGVSEGLEVEVGERVGEA